MYTPFNIPVVKKEAEEESCSRGGDSDNPIVISDSPEKSGCPEKKKSLRYDGCGPKILKARIGAKWNLNVTSKFQMPKLKRSHSSDESMSTTSDDDISSEDIDETPTFHDENKEMPLFPTQPRNGKSFKAREVLDIVYKDQPGDVKCTRQPMKYNSAFLVDVRVIPLDDLPADGNGRYVNNGQVTHTYTKRPGGKWKKKGDSRLTLKTENDYHLTREYRKQGDFRQTIFYLNDIHSDIVNNVALLQYTFTGKGHDLAPTVHGNTKRKKVFTRTKPSVRRKLQENLSRHSVSEAVAKTRRELGGPLSLSSDAEMPRGRTQAYDMKRARVGVSLTGYKSQLVRSHRRKGLCAHAGVVWRAPHFVGN